MSRREADLRSDLAELIVLADRTDDDQLEAAYAARATRILRELDELNPEAELELERASRMTFYVWLAVGALVLGALIFLASTAEPAHIDGRPGLTSPL